jgi:ethanolamine utilization protein EutA
MDISKIEEILSVGIDLGTTTSSVVVSKLAIKNVAAGFVVPKIEIIDKTIIYRSDVFFTPLIDDVTIDFSGIEEIVKQEYKKALINPEEIKTGAVIITGDTARKENAELVLKAISQMAGSFVVATAGPHLEAYIAGLGSGAAAYSAEKHIIVANADVGGGTTNISIFDDGKLIATLCADIGGRLIRLKPGTQLVEGYIRGGIVTAKHLNVPLGKGEELPSHYMGKIAEALGGALVSILKGTPNSLAKELAIGQLEEGIAVEHVMFSGGIGRLLYEKESGREEDLTHFGDIGPALAKGLKKVLKEERMTVLEPDETIYATVIGAGVHTTELSGSTIFISDPEALPLKDIPSIRLTVTEDYQAVTSEISEKIERFSYQDSSELPAIVVPEAFGNSFYQIKGLVQAIAAGIRKAKQRAPLVIICEDDIGKAFGNLLVNSLHDSRPVISIDQLTMKEGDYIDIGKPLYDGGVVPVVIKTLVFSNS